jgi:pimeloyl-ACP methyl ester carboxylesterase
VFDHIAETMNHFTEALGLSHYTLYMQDYGGPVGFRMALAHPDRIEALIVQDAVAHNQGLGANWKTRRAFWADRAANESALRTNLLSLQTTRTRHVGSDPNVERYDLDLWSDEFAFLNQPGQVEIQSDLFYDYRTNVENYPKWQAWIRESCVPEAEIAKTPPEQAMRVTQTVSKILDEKQAFFNESSVRSRTPIGNQKSACVY